MLRLTSGRVAHHANVFEVKVLEKSVKVVGIGV
jgi:hypothetical protein